MSCTNDKQYPALRAVRDALDVSKYPQVSIVPSARLEVHAGEVPRLLFVFEIPNEVRPLHVFDEVRPIVLPKRKDDSYK